MILIILSTSMTPTCKSRSKSSAKSIFEAMACAERESLFVQSSGCLSDCKKANVLHSWELTVLESRPLLNV